MTASENRFPHTVISTVYASILKWGMGGIEWRTRGKEGGIKEAEKEGEKGEQ